jgi:hypothetical protein
MRATDGISRISLACDTTSGWPVRQACAVSILVALVVAAFLAARRFGGALDVALPPRQLAVAAVLVLAWALAARTVVRASWANWLAAGVLLLFAVACSFPGERPVDWLVWLSVLGLYVALQNAVGVLPARRASTSNPHSSASDTDRVLQQLTRSRTAEGHDVVQGSLVAEFASGERTVMLYVGFCPPFALHNGAQIEVRQSRAAKMASSATVEIYATDAD